MADEVDNGFETFLTNHGLLEYYQSNGSAKLWDFLKTVQAKDATRAGSYADLLLDSQKAVREVLFTTLSNAKNQDVLFDKLIAYSNFDKAYGFLSSTKNVFNAWVFSSDLQESFSTLQSNADILISLNTLLPNYISILLAHSKTPQLFQIFSNYVNSTDKASKQNNLSNILQAMCWTLDKTAIAEGFIIFLTGTSSDSAKLILDTYYSNGLDLIFIVDSSLDDKALVSQIHKAFFIYDENSKTATSPAINVINSLCGNSIGDESKKINFKKGITNYLFNKTNTDIDSTIKSLKAISQTNDSKVIPALLQICSMDGYSKLQKFLQGFILSTNNQAKNIVKALETLHPTYVGLILDSMAYTKNQIAQKLINFTDLLRFDTTKNFLSFLGKTFALRKINQPSGLITILESNDFGSYDIICKESTDSYTIYLDLLGELDILELDIGKNLFSTSDFKDSNALKYLQFLSTTNSNPSGFPYLIFGILHVGDTKTIIQFCEKIITKSGDVWTLQNSGKAINNLGNRLRAGKFVSGIWNFDNFINLANFSQESDGLNRSNILVDGLCSDDGTVPQKFIKYCINDFDSPNTVINAILYKNDQNGYAVTIGFIRALENKSSNDNIVLDYKSFLTSGKNPYQFIQSIERMAGDEKTAQDRFEELLSEPTADRASFIKDIFTSGDNSDRFLLKLSKNNGISDILPYLQKAKQKSGPLYQGLLVLSSRISDDEFQDFRNIMETKAIQSPDYDDILDGINQLDQKQGDIKFAKATKFIQEIHNNPNFMEALHQAFDETLAEEAKLTIQFINVIYDKGNLIDALDALNVVEAKVLIKSFVDPDYKLQKTPNPIMYNIIDCINNLPSLEHSEAVVRGLLYEDPKNTNDPVSTCKHVIKSLQNITDSTLWLAIIKNGEEGALDASLLLDFEKSIMQNNPGREYLIYDKVEVLIKNIGLINILKEMDSDKRIKLLNEIFADPSNYIKEFGIFYPETYVPLLMLYNNNGDYKAICLIREQIKNDIKISAMFNYFVDKERDPYSKLLTGIVHGLGSIADQSKGLINTQKIENLQNALSGIIDLRNGLFRFAHRRKIGIEDIKNLVVWLMEEDHLYTSSGNFNYNFDFPSEKTTVVEDAAIYSWYLKSIE